MDKRKRVELELDPVSGDDLMTLAKTYQNETGLERHGLQELLDDDMFLTWYHDNYIFDGEKQC